MPPNKIVRSIELQPPRTGKDIAAAIAALVKTSRYQEDGGAFRFAQMNFANNTRTGVSVESDRAQDLQTSDTYSHIQLVAGAPDQLIKSKSWRVPDRILHAESVLTACALDLSKELEHRS